MKNLFFLLQGLNYNQEKLYTVIDTWALEILQDLQQAVFKFSDLYGDDAKVLCIIMMLFYLSMKAYVLITGDGKLSLIPLLRPFAFFLIVSNFNAFVQLIHYPIAHMDAQARNAINEVRVDINDRFQKRHQLREDLITKIYKEDKQGEIDESFIQSVSKYLDPTKVAEAWKNIMAKIQQYQMIAALKLETSFQKIIETIILVIFKSVVYLLYYIRIFLIAILRLIGPIVFALSIVEAYRDLWLQWISKFVAVSFYGAFAHIAIMLTYLMVKLGIDTDITAMQKLNDDYDNGVVGAFGAIIGTFKQGTGGGLGLLMWALTGAFGLMMVPLVSVWVLGANSTTQLGSKAMQKGSNMTKNLTK